VAKRPAARIVAVAGGKGGTGKSTVAANLALAFGRAGVRVVVVDADLGAANLHTMFGVLHPDRTLADFLDARVDGIDDVVSSVAPSVGLAAGTSRPGAANLSASHKLRLIRAIARTEAELVLLDIGAGTSFNVIDLLAAADHKLFVLTPQLPSLHNAYALLKACVHRVVRKLPADETHRALIDSALAHESRARSIPQLLPVLRPLDHELADRIVDALHRFGVGLIGNQLAGDGEVNVFSRISQLVYEQLLVHAPVLGTLRRTPALAGSLRAGAGTIAGRHDDVYAVFNQLARTILDTDLVRLRGEERTTQAHTMPLWIQRELSSEPSA
jgi:flagellar biosynthesis protein FlhG